MRRFLSMLLLITVGSVVFGQVIEPITPPDSSSAIAITYPVPVLTVSGDVTIVGTANLPALSNFFLEFRPLTLNEAGEIADTNAAWFPATLPNSRAVVNDVLGLWNTRTAPDGLYELRLVAIAGRNTQYFRVSPLRVLNDPQALSPFAVSAQATPTPGDVLAGAQATQAALATLFAFQNNAGATPTIGGLQPTPATTGPRVVAQTNANVRSGDSTLYPTVGSLLTGSTASVLGISSTGTGWFYIELANGRRGFISPSTVRVEGSLINVPSINPPPVPATPTPPPTPTPVTQADLLPNGIATDPAVPQCNQPFNVRVNIINNGTGPSSGPAQVQVIDRRAADGQFITSAVGSIPALSPGQGFLILIPLNVSTYVGEAHQITAIVNYDNAVPEVNNGNNSISLTYTLGPGGC